MWRFIETVHKVFLSLGSNIGDKVDYLDKAVEELEKNAFIHKVKSSSYYSTAPVGFLDQDEFVNIAVMLETSLSPLEMLDVCQNIESTLNRVRLIRWGPRTIDVDIILYDDLVMNQERLIIPHPRAKERSFVLIPLMELDDRLEIDGQAIRDLIKDDDGVRKML